MRSLHPQLLGDTRLRSFVRANPCFILLLALLPGLLLVEAGATAAGLAVELALVLVCRGLSRRHALALLAVAGLLLTRAHHERERRLAELAAWRSQPPGLLELVGRAEGRGGPRGRVRLLFRVERVAAGPQAERRPGWVRLFVRTESGRLHTQSAQPSPPPVGRRIRVRGRYRPRPRAQNPGTLDWGSLPGGPRVQGSVTVQSWVPLDSGSAGAIQQLREQLSARLERLFPPLAGGFMQAALLGDRENLDPRLREVFSRTGTGHIVAISGMNVAILATIGWAALSPLVRSTLRRRCVLAAALLLYIPLGGNSPSVARAAFMGVGVLAAQAVARRILLPNALGAAGVLLLAVQPEALLDPSFQLSFVAVLGLALVPQLPSRRLALAAPTSPVAASLAGLVAGALDLAVLTLVSSVATLPLTLAYFRHLPLLSIPANLAVVPALGVLTAGGLAALAFSALWPALGTVYARACDLLLLVVFRALEICAAPDWAWQAVPGPRLVLACGGLGVSVLAALALRLPHVRRTAAALVALLLLALPPVLRPASRSQLEVAVLSVGQGDAIALLPPGGRAWLVDGGPAGSGEAIVDFFRERGVRRLARVIATHPDADHVGGLAEVLEEMGADSTHDPGQWGPGTPYRVFLERSWAAGAGYRPLVAGERLREGDLVVDVLWPPSGYAGADPYWEGFATNDASLILLASFGGFRILLSGDAGGEVERRVVERVGADSLTSRFLKVSHHGSRFSTTAELLGAVDPTVALVSVGQNRYGHPHPEVLGRLERSGARVWRTDRHGALLTATDGRRFELRGYARGTVARGELPQVSAR